jgi:riboflavin kinase/FMN adenylyltransferase
MAVMDIELEWVASDSKLPHSVVGIGVFDGVHRGHRALLDRVVARARALSVPSVILTFEPHPGEILTGRPMPRLASLEDRLALIADAGVTHTKVIRFAREFAQLSAEEFVRRMLVGRLGVAAVVVGFNFTFGRGGVGTPATLQAMGRELGFEAEAFGPVTSGDRPVSSSAIREALKGGDVTLAANLLGRLYRVHGRVVTGDGRGRTIGFPTANLAPEPATLLMPGLGVYVAEARPEGASSYPALVNIGTRPTFDGATPGVVPEIYLHGFSGDLVGRGLSVTFVEKLRSEQKFPSVESLVAQIKRDLEDLIDRTRARGCAAS